MPIYNAEKYLKRCIDSILDQTYPFFELLLIDDGSTDNSFQICRIEEMKDTRIRIFSRKNIGQGLQRNFGIQNSKGKYVTFIDSDDYVDKDYLKNLVNGSLKGKVELVIGGYKKVNANLILYEENYPRGSMPVSVGDLKLRMIGRVPDREDAIKNTVWNALYEREILIQNHILFPSERRVFSEDTVFNLDVLDNIKKFNIIESAAYNYQLNFDSTSNKYDGEKLNKINQYSKYLTQRFLYNNEAIIRLRRNYLLNVKKCIIQERYNPTVHSIRELHCNIKKIINDMEVKSTIGSYPISTFDIKPRIVFILCKLDLSWMLTLLVRYNIGRKNMYRK